MCRSLSRSFSGVLSPSNLSEGEKNKEEKKTEKRGRRDRNGKETYVFSRELARLNK